MDRQCLFACGAGPWVGKGGRACGAGSHIGIDASNGCGARAPFPPTSTVYQWGPRPPNVIHWRCAACAAGHVGARGVLPSPQCLPPLALTVPPPPPGPPTQLCPSLPSLSPTQTPAPSPGIDLTTHAARHTPAIGAKEEWQRAGPGGRDLQVPSQGLMPMCTSSTASIPRNSSFTSSSFISGGTPETYNRLRSDAVMFAIADGPHTQSCKGRKGEKKRERKAFLYTVFPKRPRVAHMFNHCWWWLAVGGWW